MMPCNLALEMVLGREGYGKDVLLYAISERRHDLNFRGPARRSPTTKKRRQSWISAKRGPFDEQLTCARKKRLSTTQPGVSRAMAMAIQRSLVVKVWFGCRGRWSLVAFTHDQVTVPLNRVSIDVWRRRETRRVRQTRSKGKRNGDSVSWQEAEGGSKDGWTARSLGQAPLSCQQNHEAGAGTTGVGPRRWQKTEGTAS